MRPIVSRCERPDLRELVPWLVNGSLEPAERAQLDRHLRDCAECLEEVRRCEELGSALREATPVAPSPHPAQLEGLLARLDRDEPESAPGAADARRRSRFADLRRATPRPVRWLVAAQLAALIVLAAGVAAGPRAVSFRTLADPPTPRVAAVRVVFAPETTEAEIRRVLLEVRAEIVGGPSPLGAYTLALPPAPVGESTDAVLGLLRARPAVRFAEPILAADANVR